MKRMRNIHSTKGYKRAVKYTKKRYYVQKKRNGKSIRKGEQTMEDKDKILIDLFEFDDVWEWKFKPSETLFIHKITHAEEDASMNKSVYMLNHLTPEKEMLCLIASEDLDDVKKACMEFYMMQHPSEP